jgi:hypothetical protein
MALGNKGQMFIILATILIVSLVILKGTTTLRGVTKQREVLEASLEYETFQNLVNEFVKALDFSIYQPENITTNIFDFGNFSRYKMKEHSIDFLFFYVGCLVNSTTQQMNVTVVNLLGETIDVSLELNTSTPQTDSQNDIVDASSWTTSFSFTPGENYNLTVNYATYTQEITIETETSKDVYVGFYDISLKTPEAIHKKKFQESRSLKS